MTLREDRVRLPSGLILDEYHVIEYPDWACILALTDAGEAVLVEQYRYGVERLSVELPAGAIDDGETPFEAARRELREETGYEAKRWTPLGRLATEPGRHTSYGHLFVAEGARRVAAPVPDDSEDLAVRLVPTSRLTGLIEEGALFHGLHVAALLWARQRGLLPDRPDPAPGDRS